MKRRFLLLLTLMAFFAPWAANGQNTLLTQNFDGSGFQIHLDEYASGAWYAYNAGSGNNWILYEHTTNNQCAAYAWNSSNAANCYLVSQPFTVSSQMSELSVSLDEWVAGSSFAETFEAFFVKASDVTTLAGVASATHYGAIASASYTNTTSTQVSGSSTSSALKGQSVRLVVHCTSNADMYRLYIDNITVSETTSGGGSISDCDYSEDFEGVTGTANYYTAGSLPTGWDYIWNYSNNPEYAAHVYSSSAGTPGQPSTGNYLGFYASGSTSEYSYAIMPAVAAGEAVNHITFKYKFESTSDGTLTYGVINGTDASSYSILGTISNPSDNPGTVDVDLNVAETAGKRIAFRWYKSSTWYTCGIDDICVTTVQPSISLSPATVTMLAGSTETITATVENINNPTITYTSSNTSVATVSGNGTTATVTGVAAGTATITASMTVSGTTYRATSEITVEDPSYCTPAPTSIDYSGITNVKFGVSGYMVDNNTHPTNSPFYGDYTSQVGTIYVDEEATIKITFDTHYDYNTYVWVDLNKNYSFEANEVVCYGTSSSSYPTTLTLNFTIPANQTLGDYRMRIGAADSGLGSDPNNANPCYNGTYGVFEDYTLRVVAAPTEPSITLDPETATLRLGSTLTLTARVRNVSDPNITYTSSDNSIATVSGNGTTATVTSVAEGTVTITASMSVGGETYTATSTIVVKDLPLRVGNGTNATYLTWEEFAANVQNTTNYSGKTIYLEKDITVTSIVPSNCWNSSGSNMVFKGTFDGQGHTITINHTATQDFTGLFRYTYGATIKNLRLEGTITSSYGNTASVIGMSQGTTNVENVISNVTIESTATGVAGMIAGVSNYVYFRGCAFTGQLNGTGSEQNGGFVGRLWNNNTHSYTNCLFAPSSISSGLTGVATFDVYESSSFTNCYYTQSFGTEQGKQAYTITGGIGINVARSGNASNTYNVSGIDAYSPGLNFTNNGVTTIYGAENDQLGLTLSGAEEYEADHGTLTGSGSNWTLTMEASNTVISAANTCPAPTQWYMPTWSVKGNTAKATLSWGVEAGNTEEWQLCLNDGQQDHYYDVKVDYEDPDITEVSIQDAGTTVICTLINLTANTTYTAKVRTVCDATEEVYSSWVEGIFTTTPKTFQDNGDFDGQWNNPNNWTPSGVPGVEDVVIDEEANISDGVVAKANDITIGENGSITIEDGGQLWHNNDDVELTIKKTITGYGHENASTNLGYQLFSSPVATEAEGVGLLNGTYNLYRFDSQANEEGPLEEWVVETSSIEPFMGYLYANEENTNITITGPVRGSSQSQTEELVYNEGYRFGGWNLMGNPFVCNAYVSAGNNEEINYYVIEESNGRAEFVPANESNPIAPMGGLMVQATGVGQSITYSRTQPNKGSGILNMSVTKVLSSKGDALLDRARVRFGNGRNLEKFQLNPNHTKIYIPEDGKDYAVVYANGAGTIPVNFKAESNGRYNISFTTEEVGFNYLHLIDNRNGNDVDLLETPYYAFDAQSTDYASRFTLVFATGHNDGDDTFAFFNNGVWIINNPSTGSGAEATLQVVDVMGRVLSSETISGSCSKAINAAPGVYMLRLINGNDVKVQKVVVR